MTVPPVSPPWQPPNWRDCSVTYSAADGQSGDAYIHMWADATECITDVCAQHWCCWMPHGWHLNSPCCTFTFQRSVTWKHSGVPATVKVASQVPLGAASWNLALHVSDLYYFPSVLYTSPFSLLFLYFLWFISRGCCCCCCRRHHCCCCCCYCCSLMHTLASTIGWILKVELERFGRKLPWCNVVTDPQFVCNDWRESRNPQSVQPLCRPSFEPDTSEYKFRKLPLR